MSSTYFIHPIFLNVENIILQSSKLRDVIRDPGSSKLRPDRTYRKNLNNVVLDDAKITFSEASFSDYFAHLRRNEAAEWVVSVSPVPQAELKNIFSKIFLLSSGDFIAVSALEFEADAPPSQIDVDWYKENILPSIRKRTIAILGNIGMTQKERDSLSFDTAVHTVFGVSNASDSYLSTAADAFKSEGLDLYQRQISGDPAGKFRIFGGWSYSAISRTDCGEEFLFVALMIRMQNDWYNLRKWRRRVLREGETAGQPTSRTNLEKKHDQIRQSLYILQRHHQELFDYRANLVPWLAAACDSVHQLWDIDRDFEFIKSSVASFRDLISFEIEKLELIQNKQQSRLLFFIAGFDTLALTGFLLSLLAFEPGENSQMDFLRSGIGEYGLLAFLYFNICLFVSVILYGFFRSR